jgi:hypothetical protein
MRRMSTSIGSKDRVGVVVAILPEQHVFHSIPQPSILLTDW